MWEWFTTNSVWVLMASAVVLTMLLFTRDRIQASLQKSLNNVLATLTPREESVLRMRFGLDTQVDQTLEEVGKNFSVTRERIRQIEAKALKKMKHPTRKDPLASFNEER